MNERYKDFDSFWVKRAKKLSLLLAHERNADRVEIEMKAFALAIDEGLQSLHAFLSEQERSRLIHQAVNYVWRRKAALEVDGCGHA
jgi:hypothetical protein